MVIKAAGVTWANIATWLGLLSGALTFTLAFAFYAGQMDARIKANHTETMAKLAKIEAALPVMEKISAELDKQIQHVRDTCCKGQVVAR